jgi:hypothetical protein
MFGRAPDAAGLGYWAGLRDAGQSMTLVADTMFGVTPARTYFPSGLSNEQIIASFYSNVLGRTADATGLAFWTSKLNAAGATPGSVITEMIDVISHYAGSDPAGVTSAALFNNLAEAAQFYGENHGSLANATTVLSVVTQWEPSVLDARVLRVYHSAQGRVDAGGYSTVALIDPLDGDLVVANVMSGATLSLDRSNGFTVDVQLLDPSGNADSLRVYMPTAADYNSVHLGLDGVEHLELVSSAFMKEWFYTSAYLDNALLESVVVSGRGFVSLYEVNADFVDTSGLSGMGFTASPLRAGTRVVGTSGDDQMGVGGTGGRLEGGGGNDMLSGNGHITLVGGAGQDEFQLTRADFVANYVTIEDFQKGSDTVSVESLVTNHSQPTLDNLIPYNYGTWFTERLSLSAGASFQAYLDAATARKQTATDYATLSWFRYDGDAYLVVDNSRSADTFQDGYDQVVKFTGLIDLSTLSYNTTWAEFT